MRRQLIQPYLLVFGIALSLTGCFKEPDYSTTPAITYKGMFKYTLPPGTGVGQTKRDSVVITIGFTDGDGNLGSSSQADTSIYFKNGGWGNYKITTLRLIDGKYQVYSLNDNNTLIFPDLALGKPKGPIEGTLDFNQKFFYGTVIQRYPTKFQIQIRDRALNVSNIVETDTLTLPYLN